MIFSTLWLPPLPHSHPLPSFHLTSILALFFPPPPHHSHHTPHTSPSSTLSPFPRPPLFWHVLLSLCCHPERGTRQWRQRWCTGPGRVQDSVAGEARASSSPSLSSSARWGEPNLSSVHPHRAGWQSQTHHLFTPLINYTQAKGALRGRRLQRPLSPRVIHNRSTETHRKALCAQPLSSMSSFGLCESRRQLVIMPLATAAMCGCHVSHREVEVRSSGPQWRHDKRV